ncbi:HIT domain-containing protein [Paracoccus sp. (in: a-proteobacteria)]|uniref:HIT domain-containing protein n=1 Tax=Paracoccus sp. TaxID=267 RepID=UPI00289DF51B|nr:HIT domain-containing protein [Paracoccus sp. (in: a-proteobacteria)]
MPAYDDQNIFARILRGEIPNDTVIETQHTLVFRDIRPQAPVHLLVIPKGAYVSFEDFAANASEVEIIDFMRTAAKVAEDQGISIDSGNGFRAIANSGEDSHQEVPHFHLHLLAGRPLGPMLVQPKA